MAYRDQERKLRCASGIKIPHVIPLASNNFTFKYYSINKKMAYIKITLSRCLQLKTLAMTYHPSYSWVKYMNMPLRAALKRTKKKIALSTPVKRFQR